MKRARRKTASRKRKAAPRKQIDYDTFLCLAHELPGVDPAAFYVTDHYANHPAVLVRLSKVRRDVLRAVLEKAWRRVAPKRLVAGHDRPRPD